MYKTVTLDTDKRGVARLCLNRPDRHHALNAEMIGELHHAVDTVSADADVHLVLLCASGPHFCAGGDLRWMQDQMQADRQTKIAEAEKLSAMLNAIDTLAKPVIGRIQGNAFGGGLGMMCVCDSVIIADHARFALTETRLGLIPATIGPFVFRRLGAGATRQIFITGSQIDAARAVQLGLAAFAVPEAELDSRIENEIISALKAGPGAMARAKALLRTFSHTASWDDQNRAAVSALADCWESAETREGINAFFNKQPAPWIKG